MNKRRVYIWVGIICCVMFGILLYSGKVLAEENIEVP